MQVSIAVGVVAHEARRAKAQQLYEQVGAVYISIDDGRLGAGINHVKVWRHVAAHNTDWSIVLEDDAQPITDFPAAAIAALQYAPTPIVSFYLGKTRPPQWQAKIRAAVAKANNDQSAWITHSRLLHAVAVAAKTELVEPMIAHVLRRRYLPIDEAISNWARINSHRIAYTHPSLVDHDDTQPSVSPHRDNTPRKPGRTAWTTGTPPTWHTEAVIM